MLSLATLVTYTPLTLATLVSSGTAAMSTSTSMPPSLQPGICEEELAEPAIVPCKNSVSAFQFLVGKSLLMSFL